MVKPKDYKDDEFRHVLYKGNKKELVEIPFHEVEKINLNNKGKSVPFGNKNVVNLNRYMLRYWTPIIGSNAVLLYLHLWEFCIDEGVDMCYAKTEYLAEKMKLSKPTILSALQALEDNNFIFRIRRFNLLGSKKETSPLIILRETIPLLSREQYHTLPKSIQEMHDKYMEKFAKEETMDMFSYDSVNTYKRLHYVGDKIVSKKARAKLDAVLANDEQEDYLMDILPDELKSTLTPHDILKEKLLEGGFSTASAFGFFDGAIMIYNEKIKTIEMLMIHSAQIAFTSESINVNTDKRLLKCIELIYGEIEVSEIVMYSIKNYIIKIMKSK